MHGHLLQTVWYTQYPTLSTPVYVFMYDEGAKNQILAIQSDAPPNDQNET